MSRTVGTERTDYWYDITGLTLETGAANATYLRDPGGKLLSTSNSGSVHNYARDRLDNITALVSTSGTLSNSYGCDPYGKDNGMTGTVYNPYRYTGMYQDMDTELYQMGAQYYQAGSGRFTQLDPLPSQMLEQRYAYAGGNPVNFTDPTGMYHIHCEIWANPPRLSPFHLRDATASRNEL